MQQNNSPIFIVGAPRSGTTLTARILGRHPSIYAPAPGETNFFEDVWTRRNELGELQDRAEIAKAAERTLSLFGRFNLPEAQTVVDKSLDVESLTDKTTALGGGYAALYTAFTGSLAAAAGKPRFCDDTPKHLFYVPTILEMFPNAKIVACIRDPRDFLNSYKNLWLKSTEGERIRRLFHPVNTALLWKSSATQVRRYSTPSYANQVSILRYETLVEDPIGVIQGVCDFLNVNFQAELLQVQSHNSSFEDQPASGVFQTSVGRWKEQLSAEEIWCAQTLNAELCSDFGYELQSVSPSYPKLMSLFSSSPPALIRAMNANKHKRGPAAKYLYRRLQALVRPQSG